MGPKTVRPRRFIAEQLHRVSHDSWGFTLWGDFYFSLLNLIVLHKWTLPSAMSPNRSPSRSRERRRRPSSHFHQEQQESEQQHSPPPPKMPLSLWISEDGAKSKILNLKPENHESSCKYQHTCYNKYLHRWLCLSSQLQMIHLMQEWRNIRNLFL